MPNFYDEDDGCTADVGVMGHVACHQWPQCGCHQKPERPGYEPPPPPPKGSSTRPLFEQLLEDVKAWEQRNKKP